MDSDGFRWIQIGSDSLNWAEMGSDGFRRAEISSGGLRSYQPERSKDGKTADIGHAKFEEGEGDDDEIKDVPTLL